MKKGIKYPHLQRAEKRTCPVCGREFRGVNDHTGKFGGKTKRIQKYCSKKCWEERRILKKCLNCGNDIITYGNTKYCCKSCAEKHQTGTRAPRYKDGKSLERERARHSSEIKEWRVKVFQRDKYTCQHCGGKGDLHAHHIIEWSKDESKRFDVNNGLTLCVACHSRVHGKDFAKRNNKTCMDCGAKVKAASKLCRSCSITRMWAKRRNTAR